MKTPIIMDGITYRVMIVYDSLARSFELREGPNAGEMLSGRYERDLLGTRYGCQMAVEPDPEHPEDYDAFFDAVSAPVETHRIKMPYGQGFLEYDAMISSGGDNWRGRLAGKNRYSGLVVNYVSIEPQRVPE